MSRPLILALTKGRILKETLPLLAEAGIEPLDDIKTSRKLVFATSRDDVRLVILRGTDVPTYVRHGAADVGVVGKDILLEQGADGLYEPLDLGIARCRLMTAAPVGWEPGQGRIRVATKFVNVARAYFASRGMQVELIKLYGAMELAPIMDLADVIVDIVDTGNTLKANGLEPLQEIAQVSSRLVVNKASMRAHCDAVTDLTDALARAVAEGASDAAA
ncbi:ATP phosphoribosyltransferase [Parahalioglobus pacificus]|uniref:ATP phosphoribosyltransferase n=1 Tax=Parahalioglobus pacificus TaxID=930806 RepID=A0A919CHL6_9GAMM|nr:ATP phosphoribosyltransferase [Halioglobus pacificus]NQY02161.1 ATP phosphoribosyltransferase [Halieaceae bacterium]GHD25849.1 ATP phosphoribosyltransferase [Halioglobus pacificus]